MAEWLRRLTRNQMGSSRVGSNPTRSEENSFPLYFFFVSVRIRHLVIAKVLAAMAEWLRRLTRNQMGSPRTGSNPVGCELFFTLTIHLLQIGKNYHDAKFEINMLKNQIVIEEVASNVFFLFLFSWF